MVWPCCQEFATTIVQFSNTDNSSKVVCKRSSKVHFFNKYFCYISPRLKKSILQLAKIFRKVQLLENAIKSDLREYKLKETLL